VHWLSSVPDYAPHTPEKENNSIRTKVFS